MKRSIIYLFLSVMLSGCLGLQEDADYEPQLANHNIYMSVWEFINLRSDIFGTLKEAIELTGMQAYYTQTENVYTYALMRNSAFETKSSYTPSVFQSMNITSLAEIDTEEEIQQLREILLYHIIKGKYHGLGTLSYDPINVLTLKEGQNAVMTMRMNNSRSTSTYSSTEFNYDERRTGSYMLVAETSNVFANNGVIHVMSKQVTQYQP